MEKCQPCIVARGFVFKLYFRICRHVFEPIQQNSRKEVGRRRYRSADPLLVVFWEIGFGSLSAHFYVETALRLERSTPGNLTP